MTQDIEGAALLRPKSSMCVKSQQSTPETLFLSPNKILGRDSMESPRQSQEVMTHNNPDTSN
jgi:hypothetical protein